MINREHTLWGIIEDGHVLERPVLNEEQHTVPVFGDPATPILKAYLGDPVGFASCTRVKETHVFHLHLYEWHAVAQDQTSPRIDAISVSPQTAHTIEPVWGAGNRHQIAADVIWHCHLYPHFHEGMWGMFRTFETLQLGEDGPLIDNSDQVYSGRPHLPLPDGRASRLLPLPDGHCPPHTRRAREPPLHPGKVQQKSPARRGPTARASRARRRTAILTRDGGRHAADFDYRPADAGSRQRLQCQPVPGDVYPQPVRIQQTGGHDEQAADPGCARILCEQRQGLHDIVGAPVIVYKTTAGTIRTATFHLEARRPSDRPGPQEPLSSCAARQIVNVRCTTIRRRCRRDAFDVRFPPCDALRGGECRRMCIWWKFDPGCAEVARWANT